MFSDYSIADASSVDVGKAVGRERCLEACDWEPVRESRLRLSVPSDERYCRFKAWVSWYNSSLWRLTFCTITKSGYDWIFLFVALNVTLGGARTLRMRILLFWTLSDAQYQIAYVHQEVNHEVLICFRVVEWCSSTPSFIMIIVQQRNSIGVRVVGWPRYTTLPCMAGALPAAVCSISLAICVDPQCASPHFSACQIVHGE